MVLMVNGVLGHGSEIYIAITLEIHEITLKITEITLAITEITLEITEITLEIPLF